MSLNVNEITELLRSADMREFRSLERSLAADTRKGVKKALEVARRRLLAEESERKRIESLYEFERSFLGEGQGVIVGLDEVGRGAIAGPLAVGAVALPDTPRIEGLNDSKKLTPDQREDVSERVKRVALAWTVAYVEPGCIDGEGMAHSLKRAFTHALDAMEQRGIHADVVLVDGNPLHIDEREINVVKGDAKCASIAAASIVAKVERDHLMMELDERYPGYGFRENKGYGGSPHHADAIKRLGLSDVHRRSFCRSFMQETLF